MDFETLLKQWANTQGFKTWSQDHAAVLRNLAKWLNQHAAQQSVHWTLPMCSVCGESVARKSGMCEDCEMLALQSQ